MLQTKDNNFSLSVLLKETILPSEDIHSKLITKSEKNK